MYGFLETIRPILDWFYDPSVGYQYLYVVLPIALVIAIAFLLGDRSKMRNVHTAEDAEDYVDGGLELLQRRDSFSYETREFHPNSTSKSGSR